jgi:hypothetical protein
MRFFFKALPIGKETIDYGAHFNSLALEQNDLCQEDRKTGKVFYLNRPRNLSRVFFQRARWRAFCAKKGAALARSPFSALYPF